MAGRKSEVDMPINVSLNQKGMTLVEVMMAVALLGGVSLLTAKLMTDQANNQNFIKAKAEMLSTLSRVESIVSDPVKCRQMLATSTINPTGTPASSIVALGASSVLDENVLKYFIYRNGSGYGTGMGSGSGLGSGTGFGSGTGSGSGSGTFQVNLLGEANYGLFSIPDRGIYLQESAYGSAITELVIVFNMTGKKGYFGSDIGSNSRPVYIKKIPFVSQKYKTGYYAGKLESCGALLKDAGQTAQQKMCTSLGPLLAEWVDSDPLNPFCRLREVKCPNPNEVPSKMIHLGKFECVPFNQQVDLNQLFDTSTQNCTGKPNLQLATKLVNGVYKIQLVCN